MRALNACSNGIAPPTSGGLRRGMIGRVIRKGRVRDEEKRGTDAVRLGTHASLVSLVRDTRQKCFQRERAFHRPLQVHPDVRVRIVLWTGANSMSSALCQGIPIGPSTLRFIPDASVEI